MRSQPLTLTTSDGCTLVARSSGPTTLASATTSASASTPTSTPTSTQTSTSLLPSVVITHPHPSFGGSMDVPVVQAMFERAVTAGCTAIMFNFRGAGGSTGRHDSGVGERLDVAAAIDAVVAAAPGAPVLLAGYSFGAGVALHLVDVRLVGWFMIAPQVEPGMPAAHDPRPKRFVVPEHDQFCSPEQARSAVEGWANTEIIELAMADHFLAGSAERAADGLSAMIDQLTATQ